MTTSGPPPPFDAELAAALDSLDRVRLETLSQIPAARASVPPPADDPTLAGYYQVEERDVPGSPGDPGVHVVVCRPRRQHQSELVPVLLYIHGGGLVVRSARDQLEDVVHLAAEHRAVVASVDYRLAPETQYPGQVEDCYAALTWLAQSADELRVDPRRIIIVGTSAGGGLAAATTLLSRDRNGPAVLGQLLMCPMLDDRNNTASAFQMEGIGVWDRTENGVGWAALLGDVAGGPSVTSYAAPAREADLSRLPATFMDVGSAETFRDEVVEFASRLWAVGGRCELHVWPGGFHGYFAFTPEAALSRHTVSARANWLDRMLKDGGSVR